MRKRKKTIGLFLAFIIGMSVLAYPHVSNLYNQHRAEQLITEYTHSEKKISEKQYNDEKHSVEEYNKALVGQRVPDVFQIRENKKDAMYESLLNLNGDSIMGYIEIPKINVHIPIYHYTTDEVLEKGAGHLVGSSLPFGGDSTHSVITAHRGLPSAKLFTDLNLLEESDIFLIHVFSDTLAYQVDKIETVLPTETRSLSIEPGEDLVTLMTCTPYAKNTHRLLVRGHHVPYTSALADLRDTIKPVVNTEQIFMHAQYVVAGVLTACVILLCLSLGERALAKRKSRLQRENRFQRRVAPAYVSNNAMRNQTDYRQRAISRTNERFKRHDNRHYEYYPNNFQPRRPSNPTVQIRRVDAKGRPIPNNDWRSNRSFNPGTGKPYSGEDKRR